MRSIRLNLDDAFNLGGLFDDISLGAAAAVLVFILVLLTSPLAGISVFFSEWLLVLLLVPLTVAYRIVFRRPWCLYAESADGHDLLVTSVIGWNSSQQVIGQVAQHIRAFGAPPEGWTRVAPAL